VARVGSATAAGEPVAGPLTVWKWAADWIEERKKLDLEWKNDEARLHHHVLTIIGDMKIADVRTRHIIDVFNRIRTNKARPVAQRTMYTIYSTVCAMFRDAKLADKIEQSPCCLDDRHLGPLIDKDPEWRATAIFSRDEVETIISHPGIPLDRRIVYALELLAGVRTGEAAALRWRHYDPTKKPLGELLVAFAYSTCKGREKTTKTDSSKHVPVHPTLAAMLAEWKLGGWAAMMGRHPEPDDLIVPLPPEAAARRRTRSGQPFRGHYYSGDRWRREDLPTLGWRHRRHYDMRATFITLVLEDGADQHIIETRVTHTRKRRSAFDGYNRASSGSGRAGRSRSSRSRAGRWVSARCSRCRPRRAPRGPKPLIPTPPVTVPVTARSTPRNRTRKCLPIRGGSARARGLPTACATRARLRRRCCCRCRYRASAASSAVEKKNAISSRAVSGASEPWTALRSMFVANSLRIVPAAAFSGFVAPITSRFFATASSPSSTCTITGPSVMNLTRSP
jgi:integrase